MRNPASGDVIEGAGGLRKMRLADAQAALLINLVRRYPDTVEKFAAI